MRILVKNLKEELRKHSIGLMSLFVLFHSIRRLTEEGKAISYFGFLLYILWETLNKKNSFKRKISYLFFMIATDRDMMIGLRIAPSLMWYM
jgi:hypothetical protein